jgi:hypothetical protein
MRCVYNIAWHRYFHKTNAIGGCNAYGLPFECCVANGNQGWPRFTSHLYGFPEPNGDGTQDLAVLLYAPNSLDTTLRHRGGGGKSCRVQVTLDTEYPFGDTLNFSVVAGAQFKLRLRIPQWAARPTIAVGSGPPAPVTVAPDGFHTVSVPQGESTFTLTLPMDVRIQDEQAGGVSVHAGALLFALDLNPAEHTTGPGGCYYPPEGCEIAALKPSVNWRQGLLLDKSAGPSGGLTVERIQKGGAAGITPPFNRASVALRIVAKATSIANTSWPTVNCTSMESGCHDCVGPIPSEAVVRENMLRERESEVLLLPFGATDIRMGVLPATWI